MMAWNLELEVRININFDILSLCVSNFVLIDAGQHVDFYAHFTQDSGPIFGTYFLFVIVSKILGVIRLHLKNY